MISKKLIFLIHQLKLKAMTQQENQIALIANRFAKVNTLAKTSRNAIAAFRIEVFASFLDKEDMHLLIRAEQIMEEIAQKTTLHEAVKYYNSTLEKI